MNSPEHKLVNAWRSEVERHIVGDPAPVTELMLTLLAGGHALLESAPGLGKTTLVRTVAISAGLDLGRVQCTPDLMPMDITGGDVVLPEQSNTPGAVVFRPGPIFHQVVLADELNRATPRTQSAMLEAMQEGTVTTAGVTRGLPEPFHVLATQNPIEQEGTWPLPEAQLDRFLTMIRIPTPDAKALAAITRGTTGNMVPKVEPVMTPEDLLGLQDAVRQVVVATPVRDWAARLVLATHPATVNLPQKNW